MLITGKLLYQRFNGEAIFFEWEKKPKNACGSNSHLAVEKVRLPIHCFCLFTIFRSESGRQVSLEVLKGQRDVLDPIQSLSFFFFFTSTSSGSHMGILET